MVIDSLKNASKYYSLHPLLQQAVEYINTLDLINVADEKKEIADGLKIITSTAQGKTKETSLQKFECHNKNIDIQLCIKGKETIGWKPRQDCTAPKGEYCEEKDVLFFDDAPDTFFELADNQFAIFFPEDVHAPMIGEGEIRKMVVKVRI